MTTYYFRKSIVAASSFQDQLKDLGVDSDISMDLEKGGYTVTIDSAYSSIADRVYVAMPQDMADSILLEDEVLVKDWLEEHQ